MAFTIKINGSDHSVDGDGDGDTPLLCTRRAAFEISASRLVEQ